MKPVADDRFGGAIKRAVVAGATGLVGRELLQLLLDDGRYAEIHVPGRRSPQVDDDRVRFHACDFEDFSFLPTVGVDEVYCALGTTIGKAGSQDAFRQVDFDAVVNLARWAAHVDAGRFVVVSSLGADVRSGNFYLRTKGQMERALKQCGLNSLIIVRPSLLMGQRGEFRLGERLGAWLMRPLSVLMIGRFKKYRPIAAADVAKAMKRLAESKFGDVYVEESDQLQLLANGYSSTL